MRILQIMPAPNWVARFENDVDLDLVGWALVDFEDGSRDVVGLVCSKKNGVTLVDESVERFLGYEHKTT